MGCARNPKYACGWLLLAGLFPCRAADVVLLESRQAYAAEGKSTSRSFTIGVVVIMKITNSTNARSNSGVMFNSASA